MRKRACRFAGLIVLLAATTLRAQWKQLPGPPGGTVFDFLGTANSNVGRIYAATSNGVFLSTDSAKSWTPAGLQGKQVFQILQYPSSDHEILFASASEYGFDGTGYVREEVFRSTDSGGTWLPVYRVSGIPDFLYTASIASIAEDSQAVFLALGGLDTLGGILRSADTGKTWTRIAAAPPAQAINQIVISGQYVVALAFGQYIWRIPTSGGNWVQTGGPGEFGGSDFGTMRLIGGRVLLCGDNLYISADEGATWSHPANVGGLPRGQATGVALMGDTIVVTTAYYGMYRSSDGGGSWEFVSLPGNYPTFFGSTAYVNGQFLVGSSAGIMVSLDGENWWYSSAGLLDAHVTAIADNDSVLFAQTDRGIFHSSDRGETWLPPSESDKKQELVELHGSIYSAPPISHWNGSSWDSLSSGGYDFATSINGTLLVAAGHNISRSTDSGKTWELEKLGNGFLQSVVFEDSGKFFA